MQEASPKRWYISTKLHGITSQSKLIFSCTYKQFFFHKFYMHLSNLLTPWSEFLRRKQPSLYQCFFSQFLFQVWACSKSPIFHRGDSGCSQASPCGICGKQSGIEISFPSSTSVYTFIIITALFIHLRPTKTILPTTLTITQLKFFLHDADKLNKQI